MDDFMIDLETMGNSSDAAIVSLGAVAFDPATGELGPQFYRPISLASAMETGGKLDAGTVVWWMQQSDDARLQVKNEGASLPFALNEFALWLRAQSLEQDTRIWGNSSAFDNVILANAYRRVHQQVPWHHWNDRCYRTMKSLNRDIQIQRTGTHHNALDDALSQAQHLVEIFKWMRGGQQHAI